MPKRGETATPAQRSALNAGRAKRDAIKAEAVKEGRPKAKDRWAMLLDGRLSVADLDDQEIAKMRVRAKDGTFSGKSKAIPSHLAQQFHQEGIKRAQAKFRNAAPEAVQALLDIGNNPDVKEGDRIRALTYVVDRALGKTPEVVQLKTEDKWGSLLSDGATLGDVRDLSGLEEAKGDDS